MFAFWKKIVHSLCNYTIVRSCELWTNYWNMVSFWFVYSFHGNRGINIILVERSYYIKYFSCLKLCWSTLSGNVISKRIKKDKILSFFAYMSHGYGYHFKCTFVSFWTKLDKFRVFWLRMSFILKLKVTPGIV